jgi:methylmalonyl-CoA/ethylmalonyl-CoA epimerase
MPGGPLAHVCFVVKDLEKSIDDWTKILSVFDPGQLEQPVVRQRWASGDDVMEVATFANPNGCEIQLMCPLGDDGPVARRLAKYGEGVHHLCFTHPNLPEALTELQEKGVELTSPDLVGDDAAPWQAWTFVAPRSGTGLFIELAYPYKPVDGEWTPDYDVEATGPATARS